MNNLFEVCRTCPVQCELDNRSKVIVKRAQSAEITGAQQIRVAVSAMSLVATRRGCPTSEIQRAKTVTLERINPNLIRRLGIITTPRHPRDVFLDYAGEKVKKDKNRL